MRALFHAEVDGLLSDLARMTRLTGQMMTHASIALHQTDRPLAALVIAECDQLIVALAVAERRCVTLLALQAPVAWDLRVVVAVVRALRHVRWMGILARHVAVMARFKHPNPMAASEVRPILARMSLLTSQLADEAATAIEHQDPLSGCRLAVTEDEVDTMLRHLFDMLFTSNWAHGVERAVDAALVGRYYERFGDHAVVIAQQVCYTAGRFSPFPGSNMIGQQRTMTIL